MKHNRNILLKAIALFTLFAFVSTPVTWSEPSATSVAPVSKSLNIQSEKITIPEFMGTIQEQIAGAPDKPQIIFIQDAHAVIDAQNNISALIEYFQIRYGINLVALEGGQGKIDTTLFKTFPDREISKKVMQDYLSRAEINGAVLASIFNSSEAGYYGIEDWPLYEMNYVAYLRAMKRKDEISKELTNLRQALDAKRQKVYSAELNLFHDKVQAFREEKANLMDLLDYLKNTEKGNWHNDLKSGKYPHLKVLLDSIRDDAKLAAGESSVEVRDLAVDLKKRLSRHMDKADVMQFNGAFQGFVTGRSDAASFLKYLIGFAGRKGENLKLSPPLRQLLGYADTLATIKGTKLFEELDSVLKDMEEGLITKREEREISEQYKKILILKNLSTLELTREELGLYRKSPAAYLELLSNRDLLTPATDFYRFALERDSALHKNLEELMRKNHTKTAIVLAGGFHSEGFTAGMKEQGYSYVMITPRIQSLAGHEQYEKVMTGDLSYKDYLKTTLYDAFACHATLKLVSELNAPDFRKSLKLWRDETIRRLAAEGNVASAGRYTRYLDLLVRLYAEKFGPDSLNFKSKDDMIKAVGEELAKFRENSLAQIWKNFEAGLNKLANALQPLMDKKEATAEKIVPLIHETEGAKPSVLAASLGEVIPNLNAGILEKVVLGELDYSALDAMKLPVSAADVRDVLTERQGMTKETNLATLPEVERGAEVLSRIAQEGLPSNPVSRQIATKVVDEVIDAIRPKALEQTTAGVDSKIAAALSEKLAAPKMEAAVGPPLGTAQLLGGEAASPLLRVLVLEDEASLKKLYDVRVKAWARKKEAGKGTAEVVVTHFGKEAFKEINDRISHGKPDEMFNLVLLDFGTSVEENGKGGAGAWLAEALQDIPETARPVIVIWSAGEGPIQTVFPGLLERKIVFKALEKLKGIATIDTVLDDVYGELIAQGRIQPKAVSVETGTGGETTTAASLGNADVSADVMKPEWRRQRVAKLLDAIHFEEAFTDDKIQGLMAASTEEASWQSMLEALGKQEGPALTELSEIYNNVMALSLERRHQYHHETSRDQWALTNILIRNEINEIFLQPLIQRMKKYLDDRNAGHPFFEKLLEDMSHANGLGFLSYQMIDKADDPPLDLSLADPQVMNEKIVEELTFSGWKGSKMMQDHEAAFGKVALQKLYDQILGWSVAASGSGLSTLYRVIPVIASVTEGGKLGLARYLVLLWAPRLFGPYGSPHYETVEFAETFTDDDLEELEQLEKSGNPAYSPGVAGLIRAIKDDPEQYRFYQEYADKDPQQDVRDKIKSAGKILTQAIFTYLDTPEFAGLGVAVLKSLADNPYAFAQNELLPRARALLTGVGEAQAQTGIAEYLINCLKKSGRPGGAQLLVEHFNEFPPHVQAFVSGNAGELFRTLVYYGSEPMNDDLAQKIAVIFNHQDVRQTKLSVQDVLTAVDFMKQVYEEVYLHFNGESVDWAFQFSKQPQFRRLAVAFHEAGYLLKNEHLPRWDALLKRNDLESLPKRIGVLVQRFPPSHYGLDWGYFEGKPGELEHIAISNMKAETVLAVIPKDAGTVDTEGEFAVVIDSWLGLTPSGDGADYAAFAAEIEKFRDILGANAEGFLQSKLLPLAALLKQRDAQLTIKGVADYLKAVNHIEEALQVPQPQETENDQLTEDDIMSITEFLFTHAYTPANLINLFDNYFNSEALPQKRKLDYHFFVTFMRNLVKEDETLVTPEAQIFFKLLASKELYKFYEVKKIVRRNANMLDASRNERSMGYFRKALQLLNRWRSEYLKEAWRLETVPNKQLDKTVSVPGGEPEKLCRVLGREFYGILELMIDLNAVEEVQPGDEPGELQKLKASVMSAADLVARADEKTARRLDGRFRKFAKVFRDTFAEQKTQILFRLFAESVSLPADQTRLDLAALKVYMERAPKNQNGDTVIDSMVQFVQSNRTRPEVVAGAYRMMMAEARREFAKYRYQSPDYARMFAEWEKANKPEKDTDALKQERDQKALQVKTKWEANQYYSTADQAGKKLHLGFTDSFATLLNLGNPDYFGSCQATYKADYNRGIGGTVANGWNKALVIYDDNGRFLARRIVRLRLTEKGEFVLIREQTYGFSVYEKLFDEMLAKVAHDMGVRYEPDEGNTAESIIIRLLGAGNSEWDYSDKYGKQFLGENVGLIRMKEGEEFKAYLSVPLSVSSVSEMGQVSGQKFTVENESDFKSAAENRPIGILTPLDLKNVFSRGSESSLPRAASLGSGVPPVESLEIVELVTGTNTWRLHDTRKGGHDWYLKLDSLGREETLGFRYASMLGIVNVPAWGRLSFENLKKFKFAGAAENRWGGEWGNAIEGIIENTGAAKEKWPVLAKDIGALTAAELAVPESSGFEEILAFLAFTDARDVGWWHNLERRVIGGKERFLLFDMTPASFLGDPLDVPFTYSDEMIGRMYEQLDAQRLKAAIDRINALSPDDFVKQTLEAGYSESEIQKEGFAARQQNLEQIVANALMASVRSILIATGLPLFTEPVINYRHTNYLLHTPEYAPTLWPDILKDLFGEELAAFTELLAKSDDDLLEFVREKNPYLSLTLSAVEQTVRAMLNAIPDYGEKALPGFKADELAAFKIADKEGRELLLKVVHARVVAGRVKLEESELYQKILQTAEFISPGFQESGSVGVLGASLGMTVPSARTRLGWLAPALAGSFMAGVVRPVTAGFTIKEKKRDAQFSEALRTFTRNDLEAVGALFKQLRSDEADILSGKLDQLSGEYGSLSETETDIKLMEKVLEELTAMAMTHDSVKVRGSAVYAVGRISENLFTKQARKDFDRKILERIRNELLGILKRDEDPAVRCQAPEILAVMLSARDGDGAIISPEEHLAIIETLFQAMNDPNPKVRGNAARSMKLALRDYKGDDKKIEERTIDTLFGMLNDPDSGVRFDAGMTLEHFLTRQPEISPEYWQKLSELMTSQDKWIKRRMVALAAERLKVHSDDPYALQALLLAFTQEDVNFRMYAANEFGRLEQTVEVGKFIGNRLSKLVTNDVLLPSVSVEFRDKMADLLARSEKLGIEFPFRFRPATLEKLIKNREENRLGEGRLAVVIFPKADHNSAFYQTMRNVEALVEKGYRVMYYEAGRVKEGTDVAEEIAADLKEATGWAGENQYPQQPAALIVFGGHGEADHIMYGKSTTNEKQTLDFSDDEKLVKLGVRPCLADGGLVFLQSCSTGQGKKMSANIANWIREKIFPQARKGGIWAPVEPAGQMYFNFDNDGEVTGAGYEDVKQEDVYQARLNEINAQLAQVSTGILTLEGQLNKQALGLTRGDQRNRERQLDNLKGRLASLEEERGGVLFMAASMGEGNENVDAGLAADIRLESVWNEALEVTAVILGTSVYDVLEQLKAKPFNKRAHVIHREQLAHLIASDMANFLSEVKQVWLYGSLNTGDIKFDSDVDFLIEVDSEEGKKKVSEYFKYADRFITKKFNDSRMGIKEIIGHVIFLTDDAAKTGIFNIERPGTFNTRYLTHNVAPELLYTRDANSLFLAASLGVSVPFNKLIAALRNHIGREDSTFLNTMLDRLKAGEAPIRPGDPVGKLSTVNTLLPSFKDKHFSDPHEAVREIITNAYDAMKGIPNPSDRNVNVKLGTEGEFGTMEVSDSGPGMKGETILTKFLPPFQGEKKSERLDSLKEILDREDLTSVEKIGNLRASILAVPAALSAFEQAIFSDLNRRLQDYEERLGTSPETAGTEADLLGNMRDILYSTGQFGIGFYPLAVLTRIGYSASGPA